jgi:predicted dehydrogenase
MQKFKIGIIGAGTIVETNHLPAISIAQQAEVAWIYDKNPSRTALVAKMYGLPVLQDGLVESALQQVDVCLLATPYGVRGPYIEWCKQHHTALVVEKPFAFSLREHMDYCAGFEEWEIAVNLQRRFYRSAAVLQRIIQTGIFGRLQSVQFRQGYFTQKGGSGYISDARLAGGGVIAESAIHIQDIILWITGAQEVTVRQMRSFCANRLDYDSEFDSDIVSAGNTISVHCGISTLRNLDNGLQLQFEHALVLSDLSPDGGIFIKKGDGEKLGFAMSAIPEYQDLSLTAAKVNEAFLVFWQQFLSGLDNRSANRTSAYRSRLTTCWIEGIYKSMSLA